MPQLAMTRLSRLPLCVALAAALGTLALPADAHDRKHGYTNYSTYRSGQVVRIQCFRGPLEAVIWDHAQGGFIDDLQKLGYSPANASAIANDLCRDSRLVNNPEALKAALHARIRSAPPR